MGSLVKLNVIGLTYSQTQSSAYALVLGEENGSRRIPIVIGSAEAQSIAMQLQGLTPTRPLTHDLFVTLINSYKIKLISVTIYKFAKEVFYSEMLFEDENGKSIKIDSRTSDAVALAVRTQCPIYTTEQIMEETSVYFEDEDGADEKYDEEEIDTDADIETEDYDDMISDLDGAKLTLEDLEIDELERLLAAAIAEEDYERAVVIKEEINKRKQNENS